MVEGRLERIQGKGTFVAKPKVSQALQLTSYTEDMRAQGLEPTSQLLDIGYVTADDTLAGLLDITAGGRVLRIERLRLASGEPMAIETTHLSAKRFPALRRSLVKYTSLYTALAEVYDVRLAEAEETIETSSPRRGGRAARHGRRSADAHAVPALDRRRRRTGGVGALGVPGRQIQVRGPSEASHRLTRLVPHSPLIPLPTRGISHFGRHKDRCRTAMRTGVTVAGPLA